MNGELEHLQRRLKGLTLKRSSLAFGLWGEAGIGKTHRTLDLLRATPCRTVTVHATQDFECTARALPRPKKASVWLERFIERIERGEHLTSEQHLELLAALLTSNAPIVLHIEDIHEADPERLEFWQRLASSQTQTRGVGLLVTSRTHPPEGFEVIRLLSLVREDSDRLLEIEAGATLPSDALGWIFDRAAGNPLFTLEFFRFLSRQGFLWNDGKRWRWREPERQVLPGTVEALIEQGIARVASQDSFKDILAAKAVLGRGVQRLPLAEVAGLTLEGLDTAMDALTVQGVLAEGEFAHPLYAEVVLRDVSQEKRRILAQRALKAFNDDPLIACTFVEDASLASEQMLTMFKRAALRARVLRNETLANQFLVKAANHASGQEKGRLALEAAKALKGSDLPTAIRLGEVSLQLMPQNIQAIDLLARIFAYRRDHEKLSWVLAQLPEAEKGKLGLTIQVEVFSILNDHQSVLELVKHNPGLLESDPDTLYNIAWSMLGFGQHEEARDLIAQARERPTLRVDQRARFSYLQAIIFATHEVSNLEAELFFRQALEGFRESGKVNNIIAGLHAHATVLQDLGMYREAMLELQESAQLSIKRGNIVQYAQNNIAIADHLAWSGNYEQAETLYLESLDILRRHEPDDFLIDCLSSLSALYRMWESTYNLTLARKYASEALRLAQSTSSAKGKVLAACNLAEVLVMVGRPLEAMEIADDALGMAISNDQPRQQRNAHRVRALAAKALGNYDVAQQSLEEAHQFAKEISEPYPLQLIGLELDDLRRDLESARTRIQWFEERGLVNGANIARRYFPELTETSLPRGKLTTPGEPRLRLEVLGPMRFSAGDKPAPVRGHKRQEFLAALLEAQLSGHSEVSRLELIESFYPNSSEARSSTLLADLIYQMRESFDQGVVVTTTGGYALGSVSSDAEDFLRCGDTRLWRGAFLEGLDLAARSNTMREALDLALRARAEALIVSDPGEAARAGRILLEANPYDLEALRLTLRSLRGAGNHRGLNRTYTQARTRLLEIGETLPERWADFLETSIGAIA